MGKLLSRGKLFSLGQSMGHAWATKFRCELKAKWFRGLRVHLQCWGCGFDLWVGKMPWRREWQPTPVFLPGESHGQRSLAGYTPWGRKESDTTKQLTL